MGRNRKFVLEDKLQLAVWRTILRGSRPPSVQWAGTRDTVSAASKPNQPKPEPQKKTPPKVPSGKVPAARKEAVSPDEDAAATRQRVEKFLLRGGGRNVSDLAGSVEEGTVAGTGAPCVRAQRINEKFHFAVPEARGTGQTRRSQRQGGCCLPGAGGRSSGRGREEVGAVVGGGASDTLPVHSTARTSSRSHRLGRGEPVAGHHRQFARGDVTVESRSCSFDCHGRRRRLSRCGSPAQEVQSVTSDSVGHHRRACVTNDSWLVCLLLAGHDQRYLDLALPHPALDGRRLEVVAEGLPLFERGAAHPGHHNARPGGAQRDGVALVSARRLKERSFLELVGRGASARLVVLAGEVGGCWSGATSFLRLVGLSERQTRATHPSAESGVCLESQVGCDLILRCRTGVGLLVAEPSWRARCRW